MKILITGGCGFIGSHLADYLIARGDEVFVIDNLSTGSLENVREHKGNPAFHLTVDTITNEPVVDKIIRECDQVYHLAAAVGVKLIMERPVETLETNVKGTESVLKVTNRYKPKILIASTSEIYGKHKDHTLAEDDNRVMGTVKKHRWAYACSKTLDEFLALAYYREKKLPVVIVRFFNTVGPRQTGHYGMVIPTLVEQALLGKPLTVYGDGRQSRSFTYVGDVVEGIVKLMNEPKAVGEIFNIGTGEEITIKELAQKIKAMTKSTSEIIYIPYRDAYGEGFEDMQRRTPNIAKIAGLIGFRPKVSLDGILEKVIEYFKSS